MPQGGLVQRDLMNGLEGLLIKWLGFLTRKNGINMMQNG
jgi:hypothetical protein